MVIFRWLTELNILKTRFTFDKFEKLTFVTFKGQRRVVRAGARALIDFRSIRCGRMSKTLLDSDNFENVTCM